MRQFINAKNRNPADAEDVLQNVFLKIHARFETLKHPDKICGWLFQIAKNTATDFYRARRFEAELPDGCYRCLTVCPGFTKPPSNFPNWRGDSNGTESYYLPMNRCLEQNKQERLARRDK